MTLSSALVPLRQRLAALRLRNVGGARWGAPVALLALALALFLPGFARLPVTDRDEARFVQASRQMVQSGDWVDIRFGDEPRLKKPAGIYWLQSAAALASTKGGEAPLWVHRLPSLLGALAAVFFTLQIGTTLFGRTAAAGATPPAPRRGAHWRAAFWGAALLASTLVLGAEARLAKTDAVLLATVLAAQSVLARLWSGGSAPQGPVGRGAAYLFWGALAVGVLVKGPIGLAVVALTVAALALFTRSLRWLAPLALPGAILFALALAAPWFIAITARGGMAFWQGSVGVDLLPKMAAGQEGKGAPPGSYIMLLWLTFWPAAVALVLAVPGLWRARATRPVQFLAAWVVPFWLLLEAVPTKLVHYPLPLYPALALAAAAFAPTGLARAGLWLRAAAGLAYLPGLALGAGLVYLAVQTAAPSAAMAPLVLGLALATLSALWGLGALARRKATRLFTSLMLCALALWGGVFAALPGLDVLWPGHRAVAAAQADAAARGCGAPQLAGWGFNEPSLLWLAGRQTLLIPASGSLPEGFADTPCSYLIRAAKAPQAPEPCRMLGHFAGFALGAGREVALDLLSCGAAR